MKFKYTINIPEYQPETYEEALTRIKSLYIKGKISLNDAVAYLNKKMKEEVEDVH